MLWLAAIMLSALWLLGMVIAFPVGVFIHILLIIAIIVFLVTLLRKNWDT